MKYKNLSLVRLNAVRKEPVVAAAVPINTAGRAVRATRPTVAAIWGSGLGLGLHSMGQGDIDNNNTRRY